VLAQPGLVQLTREAAGDPEGALILLHGRATDESDLHPLLGELDPERRLVGLTPGGPITDLPPGGRHWYVVERIGEPDEETFLATMGTLCRFLDDFLRERGIGWERTVIGGFSQGAAIAYSVAFGDARPAPAGVLAMSSFMPTVRGWHLDLHRKREVPVYISHGAFDNMIPVGFGRRARDLLEEAGNGSVVYRESRVPHAIDPELLPEMRAWIAAAISGGARKAIAGRREPPADPGDSPV
jgi:phospholipase/carboxylesterase